MVTANDNTRKRRANSSMYDNPAILVSTWTTLAPQSSHGYF